MAREIQQNEVIPGCGFHHVAVRTPDFEGSLKFWLEGMGFHKKVEWGETPRRAALLDMGDGNYLEVFEREPLPDTEVEAPIFHFCLRTNDVDSSFARALEAGATPVSTPSDPPVFAEKGLKVRIAFVKGPGGEVCEFFQCNEL